MICLIGPDAVEVAEMAFVLQNYMRLKRKTLRNFNKMNKNQLENVIYAKFIEKLDILREDHEV
jgi:hypothetical protein